MPRRTLIVFAKAPRFGLVKSRLGRDIGIPAATFWYRHTLSDTLRRLGRPERWNCMLYAAPHHARFWSWPGPWRYRPQAGGDLGHRMLSALRRHRTGPTVLIGSDIPGIGPGHIEDAFRALGDHDAVFGPSEDGGYWLVGFSPLYRGDPFRNVRWSSETALEDTIAGFAPGTRIARIREMRDVDRGADLLRHD